MSTVQLRPAHWRDIAAMAALEARAFPLDPWGEGTFWSELAQRPRRRYLVLVDEVHLGHVGMNLAGEVADIMTVAVRPEARGRGLGRLLLEAVQDLARSAGASRMMLEVRADNEAALGLYRAQGYHTVSTRPGYYRDGAGRPAVDALVLGKEMIAHD